VDPFFSAAALHFNQMFARYGTPIIALSLIKVIRNEIRTNDSKRKEPLENQNWEMNTLKPLIISTNSYPQKVVSNILHGTWLGRQKGSPAKPSVLIASRDQDVIETLESIAQEILSLTGFFQNGADESEGMSLQNGICRTNCVDCLDRTNACQFIIAKRALGLQLYTLGIINKPDLSYDTDAVNLLMEMFHDHGDTIALQYGGSHLVNTMEVGV